MPHVKWQLVEGFDQLPLTYKWVDHPSQQDWPVGNYNHMIQFWLSRVFQQPAVRHLDYYCRMDTDSSFLSPSPVDIFHKMHEGSYKYGYRTQAVDPVAVTGGLWDFLDGFLTNHPHASITAAHNGFELPPVDKRNTSDVTTYYNNFEVVNVKAFTTSKDIRDFTKEVEQTNNVYNRRWGDAPLRFVVCQLFLDVEVDVLQFCEISYEHQGLKFHASC
ncbi:hypothetical protein WJX77_004237 [Trebouxia sp. C0004]